jgi:hypothetical protein
MRLLHKTTIEKLDKPLKSFFWVGSTDKRKCPLSSGSGSINKRKRRWLGFERSGQIK